MINICEVPGCDKIAEDKYCATHSHIFRKLAREREKELEKRKESFRKQKERNAAIIESFAKGTFEAKTISHQSKKQASAMRVYIRESKVWLPGKMCAVYPSIPAVEIHHMKGRRRDEYADQWAKDNGIPLLLDKRFWLPVSSEGHAKITEHSNWAIRMGFSYLRTEKKEYGEQ